MVREVVEWAGSGPVGAGPAHPVTRRVEVAESMPDSTRTCLDCPEPARSPHAQRCAPCALKRLRAQQQEWKRTHRDRMNECRRAQRARDPELVERERKDSRDRARRRRNVDPINYRYGKATWRRRARADAPGQRRTPARRPPGMTVSDWQRHRYATDSEYRERCKAKSRARSRKVGSKSGRQTNRARLADRDGWICAWCGEFLDPFDSIETHVDHMRPVSKGGTHKLSNLQLLHATCNLRKGVS